MQVWHSDWVVPQLGETGSLEVLMFPSWCPLVLWGFKDCAVEADYVASNHRRFLTRNRHLGISYIIMMWVQLIIARPEEFWCSETIIGIVLRLLLTMLQVISSWAFQQKAEAPSVSLLFAFVLTFPLLSYDRVSMLIGSDALELKNWWGQVVYPSDCIPALIVTCVVAYFMSVVPVRSRFSCVLPVLVPVVYLLFTMPFPCYGSEAGLINRLVVASLLALVCLLLVVGSVQHEMLMRGKFVESRFNSDSGEYQVDQKCMSNEGMEHQPSVSIENLPPGCVLNLEVASHIPSASSSSSTEDTCLVQDTEHSELERLRGQLVTCQYISKLNLAAIAAAARQAQVVQQTFSLAEHTLDDRQGSAFSNFSYQYSTTMTLDDARNPWEDVRMSWEDCLRDSEIACQQDTAPARTSHGSVGFQSVSVKAFQSRVDRTSNETHELQLLVCRFVAHVGIKATQQCCIDRMADMEQKHWQNTRAIVDRMTAAQNAQQPQERRRSNQRKSSLSRRREDQVINLTGSQIAASGTSCGGQEESHQRCSASTVNERQHRPSRTPSASSSASVGGEVTYIASSHPDLAQFEGSWICDNADDTVADWLNALDITGNIVVDAAGDVQILKRGSFDHVLLAGGRLVRQGPHLYRIGRSGTILAYHEVLSAAERS